RSRARHAGRLLVHHSGDAGILHAAADPGTAGRELRARLREGAGAHACRTGSRARCAALQVRRAVVAARRALSRLYRPGLDPAGRLRTRALTGGAPKWTG